MQEGSVTGGRINHECNTCVHGSHVMHHATDLNVGIPGGQHCKMACMTEP